MKLKEIGNYFIRKEKVAMLHPGRCGSTVLGSLMNQHPDIFWRGEPFEKYMQLNCSLKLKQTKRIIKDAENIKISKIYCFATKYPSDMHLSKECINMDIPDYIDILVKSGYKKFIVINRLNHLKRVISILNGRNNNLWHTDKIVRSAKKVQINPHDFNVGLDKSIPLIKYFNSLDQEFYRIKKVLSDYPSLFLNYENDIEEDPENAFHMVCDFLKINKVQVEIELKKTNPFPIKEIVENFNDIKKYFLGTKYEWMLYK